MELKIHEETDTAIFHLKGEVGRKDVFRSLQTAIQSCIDKGICFIGFNLSETLFFDTGIINLFYFSYKETLSRNGKIGFIDPSPFASEIIHAARLNQIGSIYFSDEEFLLQDKSKTSVMSC